MIYLEHNMQDEIWKDVPNYGNLYQASSFGRVKVKSRVVKKWHKSGKFIEQHYKEKIFEVNKYSKGYERIHIGVNGKKFKIFVHTFVLLAFVGEKPIGCEACHKNNNPLDNRPENLRWDTHFNNNQDRVKSKSYPTGENHPMAKISNKIAMDIVQGKITQKESGIGYSQFYRIKNRKSRIYA